MDCLTAPGGELLRGPCGPLLLHARFNTRDA